MMRKHLAAKRVVKLVLVSCIIRQIQTITGVTIDKQKIIDELEELEKLKADALQQLIAPLTAPGNDLPTVFWKDYTEQLRVDEICSEMLKPPSMRNKVIAVPSCIGIHDVSRWVGHDYVKSMHEHNLVTCSVLMPNVYEKHLSHRETLDDDVVHSGTIDCE